MAIDVRLGDVALPAGELEWRLTTGLRPWIGRVVVPEAIHRDLLLLRQPTTLSVQIDAMAGDRLVDSGGGVGTAQRLTVDGVMLLGWTRESLLEVAWRIGDVRALWRGHRISGAFNVPTQLNDADVGPIGETTVGGPLAGGDPQPPPERYTAASLNPNTGLPWTALELAAHLLAQVGGDGPAALAGPAADLRDNGVVPERVVLDGDDPLPVIARLLRDADAGVAMHADGRPRLTPAHADPATRIPADAPVADGSGGLARVDDAMLRPSAVVARFERVIERQFVFHATDDDATASDARMRLVNVLRLPRAERLAAWGRRERDWPAGAFVPIADALVAWAIDPSLIHERWFANGLERELAAGDTASPWNAIALGRVAAIRAHWRQTFAIHPEDRATLREWSPVRLALPDAQTGEPGPTLAHGACCIIPAHRPSTDALAAVPDAAEEAGRNLTGPQTVSDGQPAGVPYGEVVVLDRANGVFHVRPIADRRGVVTVVPGTVDGIPPATLNAAAAGWHMATIDAEWELTVPLAVVPAADAARWLEVSLSAADLGAVFAPSGHPAVRVTPVEQARFAPSESPDRPPVVGIVSDALNARILDAVARAAGRAVMRRHVPRWRGSITWEGLVVPADLQPFGGASIAWHLTAEGRATTTLRMREDDQ